MDWKENSMIEWLELGKFAIVQKTKNKKHVTENAYSITQAGLVPTKSFFKEKTNVTSGNTSGYYIVEKNWFVYSPSRIDVGSISYLKDEGPVIVSPIDVVFSIDINKCLPSYLLNYFFTYDGKKALLKNREGVEGMGRRNLPFDAIKSVLVPLPSLSEQTRIVGILDTFTAAIENLKQQIAERRRQYEHYRDELLDLEGKEGVEMKMIEEITKRNKGIPITAEQMSELASINGNIRVFAAGATIADIDEDDLPKNCAHRLPSVIVKSRGHVDFEFYEKPFTHKNEMWSYSFESKEKAKYLYYFLKTKTDYFRNKAKTNSVKLPQLCVADTDKYKVPVPSHEEQSHIVSILDTFEASITNLEAQLKEREKQYEYYRNKLLTFE